MKHWRGIVGKAFDAEGFEAYVASLELASWRPRFVVLHNTAVPKLAEWHKTPGVRRMRNLERYYRDVRGWSAGPHLFVADDRIWVFSPLTAPGVHSPSWNAVSWGVEMVGDFSVEPFDTGAGARVRDLSVVALAALHRKAGLDPQTLRLHREDPKTTHACPGSKVDKAEIVRRVRERLQPLRRG